MGINTGEQNMNFIKKDDLDNFSHLQIPRLVWELFLKKKIDQSTFKIYIEFFDRIKMSASNNWFDDDGNVYIKYSYDELKDILELKSDGTIANSLKLLKELKLLIQVKGFNTSSIFYLTNILQKDVRTKIKEKLQEPNKINSSSKKRRTVLHKSEDQSSKKLEANHIYSNHNYSNKIMNQDTHDLFENIFKTLDVNFTTTNQKSVAKLLKTQSVDEVKTYILETYNNLKDNPDIKNLSGIFSSKIAKGERQVQFKKPVNQTPKESSPNKEKVIQNMDKKTTKHLTKQEADLNNLENSNQERTKLDIFFNSLPTNIQEEITTNSIELAKKENKVDDRLAKVIARQSTKYKILRTLYDNEVKYCG